jgi:cell division protease FtsH
MLDFPWFPIGQKLPGGSVGRLRQQGAGFQVVQDQRLDSIFLILEKGSIVGQAADQVLGAAVESFHGIEFAKKSYLTRMFEKRHEPIVVSEWTRLFGLPTSSDVKAVGKAVRRLREEYPNSDVAGSLFMPEFDACLPVSQTDARQDLKRFAVEFLVAGADLPSLSVKAVRSVNSWLVPSEIESFFMVLGLGDPGPPVVVDPSKFSLPGRPELEHFFLEYVLEPNADKERYKALGVKMPNGVLLYGPPGSGKSFTVEKLVAALGWPVFEMDLGSVGSPFVHDTTVKLRRKFDEAKRMAPALVVLEEIDAIAPARGPMSHDHKVEEVAELLRLVETAAKNGVLVIATTNRKDALDPAILRKGRFDHAIEVGYPTAVEVRAALDGMLADRPHKDVGNLDSLSAELAGRPMSDLAWIVNDAARAAARAKRDAIEGIDLSAAFDRLKK